MRNKILLAEDDALTRFMMSEMLDELEFDYDVCKNGEECIQMVSASPGTYALVLMDIHMPQKTGIEATKDIRAADSDPPRSIPIVAITADQHWQNPARCNAAGFDDVMPKPVSMNELEIRIKRCIAA